MTNPASEVIASMADTFSPIAVILATASLPFVAYLSYVAYKEFIVELNRSRRIKRAKRQGVAYERYTVVYFHGRAETEVATVGVVEGDGVVPLKCYDSEVMTMLKDLVNLNPNRYPVIEACVDTVTFTIADVRGYSLTNKEKVDQILSDMLEDEPDEYTVRSDSSQVNRREWDKSWKE